MKSATVDIRAQGVAAESKQPQLTHPILHGENGFEAYFKRRPILRVVQQFIARSPRAEIEIIQRLECLTSAERAELNEWAQSAYSYYLQPNVNLENLSAREFSWLALMCYFKIGTSEGYYFADRASKMKPFDPFADYIMGLFQRDPVKKRELLNRAITAEVACAHNSLGEMLEVEESEEAHEAAFEHYQQADRLGVAAGSWALGYCYLRGDLGQAVDAKKAKAYFIKAAAAGEERAMHSLAFMLTHLDKQHEMARLFLQAALPRARIPSIYFMNLARLDCLIAQEQKTEFKEIEEKYPVSAYFNIRQATQLGSDSALLYLQRFNCPSHPSFSTISWHRAIALQNYGTPQERAERRVQLNKQIKRDPDLFASLCAAEKPADYEALIIVSEQQQDNYRLLFHILPLHNDPAKLVISYLCLHPSLIDALISREQSAMKALTSCSHATHFKLHHRRNQREVQRILDQAKDHVISYTQAQAKLSRL